MVYSPYHTVGPLDMHNLHPPKKTFLDLSSDSKTLVKLQ